jgi:hypothetical protein
LVFDGGAHKALFIGKCRPRFEAQRLLTGSFRFVAVMFGMQLCSFGGVVRRVMQVTLRGVRMMRRRLVIARFVMIGCFAMVSRRVLVMLGRQMVVLCRLFGHVGSFCIWDPAWRSEATECLLMRSYGRMNNAVTVGRPAARSSNC